MFNVAFSSCCYYYYSNHTYYRSIFQSLFLPKLPTIRLISEISFIAFVGLYVILATIWRSIIGICSQNEHLKIEENIYTISKMVRFGSIEFMIIKCNNNNDNE